MRTLVIGATGSIGQLVVLEAIRKGPALTAYPPNCGTSIHLNVKPGETENSVVTAVRYQVLDIKAVVAFGSNIPSARLHSHN